MRSASRWAYIFGYPLVTFDTVRQQNTNVAKPDAEHAPLGQMIKMRSYPAVDNHCCAAPNSDTLYTMVWLGVPAMGDRYYILPFLDGSDAAMRTCMDLRAVRYCDLFLHNWRPRHRLAGRFRQHLRPQ